MPVPCPQEGDAGGWHCHGWAWHSSPWAHRWSRAASQQTCSLTKAEVTGVALPECWWSGWHWGHPQVLLGRGAGCG